MVYNYLRLEAHHNVFASESLVRATMAYPHVHGCTCIGLSADNMDRTYAVRIPAHGVSDRSR